MKRDILKIISFGSMGLLMLVLIAATLSEKLYGSSFALNGIYHSPWFIALWTVLAVSAMTYILWASRRTTLILLHASLATILLGALVSFLTSQHGNILLAKDTVPASMFTTSENTLEKLPFSLQITHIDTVYSKKDGQPVDYRAHIVADNRKESHRHIVSLNNPMKIDGYSFCIKGADNGNLTLLVARDTYGLPIIYTGYLMVVVAFAMLFLDKDSGFRKTLQQLQGEKHSKSEKENIRHTTFAGRMWRILPIATILSCILWYNGDTFPVTNGAESLFLLAIAICILAFALKKRFAHLFRALTITAGITALVAVCSFERDGGTAPILRTPLLGIHVTTIIIAYALLACTAVNAVIALCRKDAKKRAQQDVLGRILLYPATMLLATGIFIGAVWANISWGRYWGWDPKEVWALITLLVCSFAFHTRSLPFMAKPKLFHIYCIAVFMIMLFTYFGVNYLLGGIHSYA